MNLAHLPDKTLVANSLGGDKASLEALVLRVRDFIYNLSFKMTWNRDDAADYTQEVLIKMITHLKDFRMDSSFNTWLYRITVNHILNEKRKAAGKRKLDFQQFGERLDNTPDADPDAGETYHADIPLLVEETKQTCMSGMLMCLDERHRMVFVLAELLGIKDTEGCLIMDISRDNFRTMLSRAKRDLYSFMHDKCGLINHANPCRCAKKTAAFIKAGLVDPQKQLFKSTYRAVIEKTAGERQQLLEGDVYDRYRQLYLGHHYLDGPDLRRLLNEWLSSAEIKRLFNFN
jgi:RNA polymerase sigma factor (sigma-70 family)